MQISVGLLLLILFLVSCFFTVLGFLVGRTWKATKYMDELQKLHEAEDIRKSVAKSRSGDK